MADKNMVEDKGYVQEDIVGAQYSEEEKRVLDKRINRKMDMRIMPWIIVSYLLNYLDRTNLGNARTLNNDKPGHSLVESLDLQGDRYLLVVAIFFIPYVLFEFPSNIAMKYFTPSRWISRIMVSWGIVTCCTAAVTTYEGLIACRVFLGIAEAGFFPGCLMYLCFWYPPSVRATRMAFFSASITVAGAFGGLISTGVGFMSGLGGLYGWQWLFILEGIPTVIIGVLIWFFLPNYPETAMWLTEEERSWACERMGPYAPKGTDKHFNKVDFFNTLKSLEFWLFSITYFLLANSGNAFGYFTPTIVETLGYRGYMGQLMTVPPNVMGFVAIVGNSYWSDRRKERPTHILGAIAFVMVGWILLATVDGVAGRYVGVFMVACTNAAIIPFVGFLSASYSGATSTAVATGGVIAIANISGVVTPYVFTAATAPRYYPGLWTLFAMLGTAAVLVCYLWYRLGSSSEYRGPSEEQKQQDFGGKGDVESLAEGRQSGERFPSAELVDTYGRRGVDGLRLEKDAEVPQLKGPNDIRIKIKALSLNARDIQILNDQYPAPHAIPDNVVPISDGAGVVEAVGEEVTLFKVGDRVAPVFPQGYHFEEDLPLRSLKRGLGGGIDGVAQEYFVCSEEDAVPIPANMSFEEGATMPVAYTTAWSSLFAHHPKLQSGQTVLCLGTGGVSLCAAQIALISGAKVILTSSSQTKLDRAKELLEPLVRNKDINAVQTIDYSKINEWDKEARKLNGGKGVDFVIEIGGRGTIGRSIRSTKPGGLVAVSGYVSTFKSIDDAVLQEDLAQTILYSAANVRGVFACNREDFKTMVSALETGGVKPIIDKTFAFSELKDAYQYVMDGKHFGKVCVRL